MFSAAFGISPGKYRLVMRLRLACRHLEQTRYSIKEISDLCGFSGQNYFCRIFRKYMKMSPGEFRRNPNPLMTARLKLENAGINPF
jgi:AraC-like DNA-binding protein